MGGVDMGRGGGQGWRNRCGRLELARSAARAPAVRSLVPLLLPVLPRDPSCADASRFYRVSPSHASVWDGRGVVIMRHPFCVANEACWLQEEDGIQYAGGHQAWCRRAGRSR